MHVVTSIIGRRQRIAVLLSAGLSLIVLPAIACERSGPADRVSLYDRVIELVGKHFHDPAMNGVDWSALAETRREAARGAADPEELAEILNDMLDRLRTSHTAFLTGRDRDYYHLLGIFQSGSLGEDIRSRFPGGRVVYDGIGVFTVERDGTHVVTEVLTGQPAERAGLRRGDRILAADGETFHPIHSFEGKSGRPVSLVVACEGQRRRVTVTPARLETGELFHESMEASARLIEQGGLSLAYVRPWSYAGERYQDLLRRLLTGGELKDADGLILDLRGGWGGADPRYLNLFNRDVPIMESIARDGSTGTYDLQWRKPTVVLIDGATRSGKEVLAFGFKTYGLATLVGERTAGAVTAGRLFLLPHDTALYLAVRGIRVNGQRLEGKGVAPDIEVPRPLDDCSGEDRQLRRAREVIAAEIAG